MSKRVHIVETLGADLAQAIGKPPEREFGFHEGRNWKFDLAYPTEKLAIEVNGQHHLKHVQNRKDSEKINAAVCGGWRVLQYPASSVTAKCRRVAIVEQVHRILCGVWEPSLDADLLTGEAV